MGSGATLGTHGGTDKQHFILIITMPLLAVKKSIVTVKFEVLKPSCLII